jgi:acyl-[acyl-carrier-protein]-phospholipid O-acyltransferase/long-chain-fatty-acid--[acyl-carrier-protein] ligase
VRSDAKRRNDETLSKVHHSLFIIHHSFAKVIALTLETEPTPATADHGGPGGLSSRSFLGLLIAQFLGAVNDNMFRWLVVPIGKQMIPEGQASLALAVGLVCLVLPFLLLAATAGYLADRFSKRTVIVSCKLAELVILVLGVAAVLSGSLWMMFGVVFLLGSQSALFGPSKFGSIPEIVRTDRISAANGLIGMTTVVAIVIGSIGGACLYELTAPMGRHMWWVSAAALVGVAVAGLIAAMQIRPLKVANPARRFPYNFPRQTGRDLALLASDRPLLRAALGAMVFWALGALAQVNVDQFVGYRLGLGQVHVGILLGILALGVGVGSVLAGVWSAGRVELGIVSLGAGGIAISAIVLSLVPPAHGSVLSGAYFGSCVWLFLLGVSAGLYQIPIQAFLQYRSRRESRGSILAASSFLAFSGMLASAVLFWLCSGPLGLHPEQIFFMLGIATVPVFFYVVLLLPGATARFLVWLLSHTVYRVRIEGRENVPEQGGALLVANHASFIDGVLLILYFPRPVRMVARADPGHRWGFRRLAEDLGTIFIEPGKRGLAASIRAAREAIRQGDLVCIFPEGQITRTGAIDAFRPGFLAIHRKTAAPVIPIYLRGLWGSIFSYEGGRPLRKWPRRWPYPVSILIGRPIADPTDTEQVRQAVAELGDDEGAARS